MTRRSSGPASGRTRAVDIEERAVRFLDQLRELGYVDPPTEVEILERVCELDPGVASFEVVRRMAAVVLFERQLDLDHDAFALLDEEWKALFH